MSSPKRQVEMEQPPLASSESRRGKAPSGVRKATTSSASPQRPLPIAARLLAAHTPDRKMTMNKMKWKLMLAVVFVASAFGGSAVVQSEPPWGPETPNFNLQVILGGEGFGLVKFRQPNDDDLVIYLDVWVRDLEPNTSYLLQRAVDVIIDGECTSTAWLTLGKGLLPQSITTDAEGTGQAELFRSVAAFPVGSEFDIHFQVIEEESGEVVLTSDCYQFTISQ
jgi:hypothetical protein